MRIELRIDRVVVDESVLGGERVAGVRLSLERELARLLTAPGAGNALHKIGAVDALSPAHLPAARSDREGLGTRLAAAIGQGVGLETVGSETSAPRGAHGGHRA